MTELKTDRLAVRNFTPENWKELQKIVVDREASEYAIYDYQLPVSDGEVMEITRYFSEGDSFLAVWELSLNRIIGYIALNRVDEKVFDMGYCLSSQYQGKGYATEACSAVINYAFITLGAEKLTSGTANQNHPSCRLLGRLGFKKTEEGIASFRKTPEGAPIEFTGSAFVLKKSDWRQY